MTGKWSVIKNLFWIAATGICLLAVVVGLVIASVNRYGGESFSTSSEIKSESVEDSGNVTQLTPSTSGGALMQLGETKDAGQEYIDRLTFLCDSTSIGMRNYGLLSGGTNTTQVWGTNSGSLRVSELMNGTIIFPSDGSEVTIADAAMISKPEILVICVGQDGLNNVDETSFKASYTAMINNIRTASPNTTIICCSISSVPNNYNGADKLTTIMISDANDWIRDICENTGVYFCDSGKSVGDGTGSVKESYLSTNAKTLNPDGINKVLEYLRTHAIT